MSHLHPKVIVFSFMFSGCFFSFIPQNSSAQNSSFISGEIANSTPSIVIPSPNDSRIAHLSWPKIIRTAKGNLVVAYSAGVGHNRGGSGPAVSVSRDNGKTFTPPKLLGYYPEDDERYKDAGNFALGTASDGAIILLAMAYSGNENNTIIGWRSEDEGSTWKPVNTDKIAQNKTGSIYGEILNVPNVGLVVFGHYRRPSTPSQGIYMSVSKDNGQTWGSPQTVTEQVYVEPAVTFSNGRFVGLFRNSASVGNNKYDLAVSDDLGKTWTISPSVIKIPEELEGVQPSPFITVSKKNPNKLFAIQSIRGDMENTRGRMYLWSAEVYELEWKNLGMIVTIDRQADHLHDWSYPWMTSLNEDEWLMVFYAGKGNGSNSIYGLTLRPDSH
ncbi:sialidase family protein [Rhodohalobacter sp. 614A]|uniref:sialidase family protein n=1 Tax=Rhodohalobacter sp. 614A TaxID=2908649 RepID=UPI001F3334CA|nr:sialidase family protein [Rhodohalobacter sp. 614A]